jgi:hypothetical protein
MARELKFKLRHDLLLFYIESQILNCYVEWMHFLLTGGLNNIVRRS